MLAGQEDAAYQWMLRAIGAYLDERAAGDVCVIETPEGFALRFAGKEGSVPLDLMRFDYDTMVTYNKLLERRRQEQVRSGGLADDQNHQYQDVFRALGWELDDSDARNVLITEVEDGLLLTFLALRRDSGTQWEKQSANLGETAMQAILRDARSRRRRAVRKRSPDETVKFLG